MALGTGEKFGATFARDADGRILTNSVGGGTATSGTALSDTLANPTVPGTGAYTLIWDVQNSQWRRAAAARVDGSAIARNSVQAIHPHYSSGGNVIPADTASSMADASTGSGFGAFTGMAYNGATFDRIRNPNTFKSVANASITAGTPATYWTPTSGKKFRLMALSLSLSVAGQILVCDNTNGSIILRSPQLAAAGVWTIGAGDIGNGILSAAANNVLKIDVTGTASVGGFVAGTEE